jgi:signal peptidase I
MTAHEPPNPYSAPGAALAEGPASEADPARTGGPSRLGAFAVALFSYPLAGAGFYLLGHRRRFAAWNTAGLLAWALLIVAVWVPLPRLCLISVGLMLAALLASLAATALTKPAPTRVKNALLMAVLLIVAGRAGNLVVKELVVEAFQIPSGAMVPALLVGDRIMVRKSRGGIARGDVIVFKYPADQRTDYVKRVVAVGGDTISVRGGVPSINGIPLDHDEIAQPCSDDAEPADPHPCALVRETNAGRSYTIMFTPGAHAPDFSSIVVPEGEVFVMGDNRDNSFDSRRWGTVKVDLVKGTATLTWWSTDPAGGTRWSRVGRRVD